MALTIPVALGGAGNSAETEWLVFLDGLKIRKTALQQLHERVPK